MYETGFVATGVPQPPFAMWARDRPFPNIPQRPFQGHYHQPTYVVSSSTTASAPQFLRPPPTAPNALAPPQRRKRASKPKVRTGCTTCKIRRIKCDEAKPDCKRCTTTGRKCDGYEFPSEPVDEAALAARSPPAPIQKPWADIFPPGSISKAFPGDAQERRIFHRFQVCTIPTFIGGSEAGFWKSIVVQVGHQEPVVRNAIIALGTLHEDYQERQGKYSQNLIQDPSYQHALHLYGTALRQLNKRLNEGSKVANTRLALISSILFTCFEVLRRNNMAAVVHYQAGMRELLRQMNMPIEDPVEGASERMPQEELNSILRVFARYDIQACTFTRLGAAPVDIRVDRVPPTRFTLAEVRTHLDNLLIHVYQLLRSDLRMYRYWKTEAVPAKWRRERDEGIATLEAWVTALEDFFLTAERRLVPTEMKSILGLRLQIKTAIIMLKTCIDAGLESSYDAFFQDFEDIVTRVERLTTSLQLPEAEPLDNETTSFTMELGIIHPLFYVATKCRDYALRRRAITQLRKAGREGVWEGPIMAVLAERIVQLEEEGVDAQHGTEIPERNRIHEVAKDVNYEEKRIMVQMTRARDLTWKSWETIREGVPF